MTVLVVDILENRPVGRLVEGNLDLEVGPKQRNRVSEMRIESTEWLINDERSLLHRTGPAVDLAEDTVGRRVVVGKTRRIAAGVGHRILQVAVVAVEVVIHTARVAASRMAAEASRTAVVMEVPHMTVVAAQGEVFRSFVKVDYTVAVANIAIAEAAGREAEVKEEDVRIDLEPVEQESHMKVVSADLAAVVMVVDDRTDFEAGPENRIQV